MNPEALQTVQSVSFGSRRPARQPAGDAAVVGAGGACCVVLIDNDSQEKGHSEIRNRISVRTHPAGAFAGRILVLGFPAARWRPSLRPATPLAISTT